MHSTETRSDVDRAVVVTRTLPYPREAVFAVFIDHARVGRWWGPHGFSTTTHSSDVRTGGRWAFTMHGPDGTDYENLVVYTAVEPPVRLAYDHFGHADEAEPHFKAEVLFDEAAGGTQVTLRMVFPSAELRDGALQFGVVEGGEHTLERLEEMLNTRRGEA
jgi:uncharacterized protein YndB with AHSA1/START domain